MWSSLALKKPRASVGSSSCLGDCHTGDQPAPKTQMDKGMFSTGGDRTGPGLHGFRPCFPCHLQSFFWIHDVLSLLELLLMKLVISFLRLLSSQLKFMKVKSWWQRSKHQFYCKLQWHWDFSLGSSEGDWDVSQSFLPINSVRPAGMTHLSFSVPK